MMKRGKNGQFKKQKHNTLVGQRFGKLTVIQDSLKRQNRKVLWECKCDCGNTAYVPTDSLITSNTKSCGCGQLEHYLKKEHNNPTFIDGTEIGLLNPEVKFSHNTSGYRGVSYSEKTQKYRAYITFKRKYYSLGTYSTIDEAIKARKYGEEKLYNPFLNNIGNNV